jgi:2-amino-4-hydroxy-6-hydroxymethyldihydropteridine diphosphokinase
VERLSRAVWSRGIGPAPGPFLNAAVLARVDLTPEDLLAACKRVEQRLGRRPSRRWGDRAIDVDILLLEDRVVEEVHLSVPHRGLMERAFAWCPAKEVAPALLHPSLQVPLACVDGPSARGLWWAPGLAGQLAGLRMVR